MAYSQRGKLSFKWVGCVFFTGFNLLSTCVRLGMGRDIAGQRGCLLLPHPLSAYCTPYPSHLEAKWCGAASHSCGTFLRLCMLHQPTPMSRWKLDCCMLYNSDAAVTSFGNTHAARLTPVQQYLVTEPGGDDRQQQAAA